MQTRREFMELAATLFAGTGMAGSILQSIARAGAIEPEAGSSFLDAEHVVILMQENRSFDHAFGTLRGVRGFNDPRAISLPDGNPVWVQTNAKGERFAPFRFDIHESKITWMGSLPHSWTDQVDARNEGHHDKWLVAKQSGHQEYADMPLTMGHYTRADIPFYYALADAFTICDQYFCSSLTGTTPNRCYLWSGTIREQPSAKSPANVRNSEVDHDQLASWPTFPERLEALGVSWKVYQNELSIGTGLSGDEDSWLANFTDNPLEFFKQYHVHLAANHVAYVEKRIQEIPGEIESLKAELKAIKDKQESDARRKRIAELSKELEFCKAERRAFAGKSLEKLSGRAQALHAKAFTTNTGDPAYRELVEIAYDDNGTERKLNVPKGDVLHQFRADVAAGKLPAVSWIVSPETFSDHPSSAWYGAWYIAEVLNILTQNPEVWKKTIFLITYDENDGYFDHVPPFVSPHPHRPETGQVTKGIDASVEYVELAQDRKRNPPNRSRESSIGLGYRVPMVIASPWSRGGCVCSQVFDHTSVLQLLEKVLSHKLGKSVVESNISRWRRTVCGDLTSSFQPASKEGDALTFPPRDTFLESIHKAQFKNAPTGFHALSDSELEQIRQGKASDLLTRQEPGTRTSCPLPYQLAVDGSLDRKRARFTIRLEAKNGLFGDRAAGSPFIVHAIGSKAKTTVRNYAVEAGQQLEDSWALSDFEGGKYHLRVYGPNGFYREFQGAADEPSVEIEIDPKQFKSADGKIAEAIEILVANHQAAREFTLEVRDNAYENVIPSQVIKQGHTATATVDAAKSAGWYDFSLRIEGAKNFTRRYAGRIESGQWSISDPAMA